MPAYLRKPELEEAFRLLEKNSWGVKELDRYERSLDYIRSDAGRFDAGKEEGIAIGKEKGITIGEKNARIMMAQELFEDFDIEYVAKKTKLSVTEVQDLQENKR